jgi:hypothetical protein
MQVGASLLHRVSPATNCASATEFFSLAHFCGELSGCLPNSYAAGLNRFGVSVGAAA